METVDRSLHDKLFDAVPFTFKPNLKKTGNPLYDRMPIKLRLQGKVNWLSKDRSVSEQRPSVKILVEWAEAFLQDLKVTSPDQTTIYSRELLNISTIHHNILVSDNQAIRATHGSPLSYCVQPWVHADMYKDTVLTMVSHKATCWTGTSTSN
jgi:hypothetical protein